VSWSPLNSNLFISGCADGSVGLWDVRQLSAKVHSLNMHTDQVMKVAWSPFNETILASCGADRRVNIWDVSRIGIEQSVEDAEDGPPELVSNVLCFCFCLCFLCERVRETWTFHGA
jgi:histone-binding protein RBBP4